MNSSKEFSSEYEISMVLDISENPIDLDNLEWLKKDGSSYQVRLSKVLRWATMNGCPLIKN